MVVHRAQWTSLRPVQYIYLFIVFATAALVTAFILRAQHRINDQNARIRHHQVIDCRRANDLTANQRLVIQTLIEDRANRRGLLLGGTQARRQKSLAELRNALRRTRLIDCNKLGR